MPDRQREATATPQLPVLFVNIGWGQRYDGTEEIRGNHGWLSLRADDCSEIAAFAETDGGLFRCGIGRGSIAAERLDLVFVSRCPADGVRRVVGVYRNAWVFDWNDDPDSWKGAATKTAYLLPVGQRPPLRGWPGQQGVRRWAFRAGEKGREHPSLMAAYEGLVPRLGKEHLPRKEWLDGDEDDELAAFEGELRRRFVLHRSRERSLRVAKVRSVLAEKGRLPCEVPGCGFDFVERYGEELGEGYAHVHHLHPLSKLTGKTKVTLEDLAIVCANCHAMIHRWGDCRPLADVRPR